MVKLIRGDSIIWESGRRKRRTKDMKLLCNYLKKLLKKGLIGLGDPYILIYHIYIGKLATDPALTWPIAKESPRKCSFLCRWGSKSDLLVLRNSVKSQKSQRALRQSIHTVQVGTLFRNIRPRRKRRVRPKSRRKMDLNLVGKLEGSLFLSGISADIRIEKELVGWGERVLAEESSEIKNSYYSIFICLLGSWVSRKGSMKGHSIYESIGEPVGTSLRTKPFLSHFSHWWLPIYINQNEAWLLFQPELNLVQDFLSASGKE